MDTKMKMEFQLLKLKQGREALKDDGAKHEDHVMKENAVMQVNLFHSRNQIGQLFELLQNYANALDYFECQKYYSKKSALWTWYKEDWTENQFSWYHFT